GHEVEESINRRGLAQPHVLHAHLECSQLVPETDICLDFDLGHRRLVVRCRASATSWWNRHDRTLPEPRSPDCPHRIRLDSRAEDDPAVVVQFVIVYRAKCQERQLT